MIRITRGYLKELIRKENKIICELNKELKQGSEHHKRSYPISLSEGKIKAYKELLENEKTR